MKRLLLLISILTSCGAVTVQQLFNITTVNVKKEVIEDIKTYNGYAKIIDSNIYTVTTTKSGYIKNITAPNLYDSVQKGQRLFNIYSPTIYKAQIELISAISIDSKLAQNIEEKLRLYDITDREIRAIKNRKKALKYLPFYSPYSGIIIEKQVSEGSFVKRGTLIYKIANLSTLWVVARAYEVDRETIQKGKRVYITFSGSSRVYSSHIDFIYPFINRDNKTIDFRATIDNSSLKVEPNSYATVKVTTSKKEILTLPSSAVITKGNKHLVFVPSEYEGEYQSQYIQAKRLSGGKFEIISGLKEGDRVVNNSLFLLDSDVVINSDIHH